MFKGFLIVVLGSIFGMSLYYTYKGISSFLKERKIKLSKMSKKTEVSKIETFEEKLANQYKDAYFSLLKKQALAAKAKKSLIESIKELNNNARQCKIAFEKTNNKEFQKNSLLFLTEMENANNLLQLANDTIKTCAEKLETADIEYKTIITKIKNKKIEYSLLGITDIKSNMMLDEFDYNNILNEYKEKIDAKRLDLKVEESITKQKELTSPNIDISTIPEKLKVAYENL